MRDPPERTTEKAPLSFTNFSDRFAVYSANEIASSSSEAETKISVSDLEPIAYAARRENEEWIGDLRSGFTGTIRDLRRVRCGNWGLEKTIGRWRSEDRLKQGRVIKVTFHNNPINLFKNSSTRFEDLVYFVNYFYILVHPFHIMSETKTLEVEPFYHLSQITSIIHGLQ